MKYVGGGSFLSRSCLVPNAQQPLPKVPYRILTLLVKDSPITSTYKLLHQ